jgi:hypothetical protein
MGRREYNIKIKIKAKTFFLKGVCRRGETTYAMGWLKWGPNQMLEDSGEGNELMSTTERNTDLPRFGALVRR